MYPVWSILNQFPCVASKVRQSSPQETVYSVVREQSSQVESGIKRDRTKTVSVETVMFDGTYDDDGALVRFSPGVLGLGDDAPGGDISYALFGSLRDLGAPIVVSASRRGCAGTREIGK